MRSTIVAAVLAISTLFAAAPAMAGEHGGKGGASFPMPAAAFQQKVYIIPGADNTVNIHLTPAAARKPAKR